MIKVSKNFWLNPAKIQVSGVRCSPDTIVKILDTLNCQWIVMTVDSVTEDSLLLTSIKEQGLKYFVRSHVAEYVEISVVIPYSLLNDFLNKAIHEEPENIFVFHLRDPANSVMCLQYSYEELVVTGIVDVFVSIALDENVLLICMNKSLASPQEVYMKIKALHLG